MKRPSATALAQIGILLTEKDGFVLRDRDTLRALAKLASVV